jgi:F-type H+-transporting ATPase subunit epsilon
MAKEFTLSVVAPDRSLVEEQVVSVIVPGSEGYFGILAGHVPLIASLRAGLVEFEDLDGQRHYVTVSGGFAEVGAGGINILADAAERATEIDVTRAERALESARMALRGEVSGVTSEEATAELERAMNRIRAAKMAGG